MIATKIHTYETHNAFETRRREEERRDTKLRRFQNKWLLLKMFYKILLESPCSDASSPKAEDEPYKLLRSAARSRYAVVD